MGECFATHITYIWLEVCVSDLCRCKVDEWANALSHTSHTCGLRFV